MCVVAVRRPGAHFIVRECAGQINMLLLTQVLGPQHLHSVTNAHYLDPSPAMQRAWSSSASADSGAAAAAMVYATISSSSSQQLQGDKSR
jgi:hypothetical protein